MSSVDVKGQICLRHYQLAAAREIQTRILQGTRRILGPVGVRRRAAAGVVRR